MSFDDYLANLPECAEEGCDSKSTHRGPAGMVCNAHIGEYGYALND